MGEYLNNSEWADLEEDPSLFQDDFNVFEENEVFNDHEGDDIPF